MEQQESPRKLFALPDFDERLGPILRRLNAADLREPLSAAEKNRRMESIDASLPDDYLHMVTLTEGVTIGDWRVFGLSEIRRILQPTGYFYLIAEALDGRALGLRQESQDQQLFFVDPEGNSAVPVSVSLFDLVA
jgi:hypothetical protein